MTKIITKAVIPIAGKGTRLLPATKIIPKELLTILDKPVIHYIVEEAIQSGIKDILFIESKEKNLTQNYFSQNKKLENFLKKNNKNTLLDKIQGLHNICKFHYEYQKTPNGSGDALLYAQNFTKDDPFAFFYADDIIHNPNKTPPLKQLINSYKKNDQKNISFCGLIKVKKENIEKYGIIRGNEVNPGVWHINEIIEKPKKEEAPSNLASVGRFILNKDIFEIVKKSKKFKNEIYLATALNTLSKTGRLFGKSIQGEWYDCGSKQGLWHANLKIGMEDSEIKLYSKNIKL